MFMLKNSIYIILFHFFTNFTLSQSNSYNYKGTIGSVPTEMTMVVSVSKDGRQVQFSQADIGALRSYIIEIELALGLQSRRGPPAGVMA
jgi:hypothetical protein